MNYIEIIVLINVMIHYGFSIVAGYITRVKINGLLLFFSIILDVIYVFLYIYFPYEFEPYKYLYILLLAIFPSINKGIIRSLFYTLVYLLLNFTLGGITEILYKVVNNFYSVILSFSIILLLNILIVIYKRININYDKLIYEIIITFDKKSIKLKGFCDTGNFLRDEDFIPVVFVNKINKMGRFYKTIDVNTIQDMKKIDIYRVDDFKIKLNNKYVSKDVYVAFVDMNYDVMFGIDILGG